MISNNYNRNFSNVGGASQQFNGNEERFLQTAMDLAGISFSGLNLFARSRDIANGVFQSDFRSTTDIYGGTLGMGGNIPLGDPFTDIDNRKDLETNKSVIQEERNFIRTFLSWLQTTNSTGIAILLKKAGFPEVMADNLSQGIFQAIQNNRPQIITEATQNDQVLAGSENFLTQSIELKAGKVQQTQQRLQKVVQGIGGGGGAT